MPDLERLTRKLELEISSDPDAVRRRHQEIDRTRFKILAAMFIAVAAVVAVAGALYSVSVAVNKHNIQQQEHKWKRTK